MSRKKPSLYSIAKSLNVKHSQHQKPDIHVTQKNSNPADRLQSGRRRCDCQARVHGLVRNCFGCGRIVCEQEGSGPCFFCGELVCTREEREILNRKSRKSIELYNKLMGCSDSRMDDSKVFTLASVGNALTKAEEYKNKLLVADAEIEKATRVHDLESDYHNMENNIFLTKEEREAIMARKEELKELRARQKRALIVNFDFKKGAVLEVKNNDENASDPVIQSILESSRKRQQNATSKPLANWIPADFVPKYDESLGRQSKNLPDNDEGEAEDKAFLMLSDEMMYMEVAKKGFAISLIQPTPTLLAHGFIRHLPWNEDVDIRGPILIASKGKSVSKDEIRAGILHCQQFLPARNMQECEFPSDFPSGAIVGRALLTHCLSKEDYDEEYANSSEHVDTKEPFVLIFNAFEALSIPIPHIPLFGGIYQVEKQLRKVIRQILDPVSFS